MKKYIAVLLALVMVLALAACGGSASAPSSATYEVAFVTDIGQLMDKSFNQGTWEGVERYATENGLSYNYYQPANGSEATDDDR